VKELLARFACRLARHKWLMVQKWEAYGPREFLTSKGLASMGYAVPGALAAPMIVSQLNIKPVFDVQADVQGRELNSAAQAIDKVIKAGRPDPSKAITVTLGARWLRTNTEAKPEYFGGTAFCTAKHEPRTTMADRARDEQADLVEEQEAQAGGGDEALSDAQVAEQEGQDRD
jgi:hypothetical protein